jgi:hypothetical protein
MNFSRKFSDLREIFLQISEIIRFRSFFSVKNAADSGKI